MRHSKVIFKRMRDPDDSGLVDRSAGMNGLTSRLLGEVSRSLLGMVSSNHGETAVEVCSMFFLLEMQVGQLASKQVGRMT